MSFALRPIDFSEVDLFTTGSTSIDLVDAYLFLVRGELGGFPRFPGVPSWFHRQVLVRFVFEFELTFPLNKSWSLKSLFFFCRVFQLFLALSSICVSIIIF